MADDLYDRLRRINAGNGRQTGGRNQRAADLLDQLRSGQAPAADVSPSPVQARAPKPRGRSVLGQIGDQLSGIPQGVAGLVASAGETLVAPIRLPYDVATGHAAKVQAETGSSWTGDETGPGFMGPGGFADQYIPLPSMIARSLGEGTLPRFGNALRGDFSGYTDASDDSRIVEVLMEDIGNVGLIGGAASQALGSTSRVVPGVSTRTAGVLEGAAETRSLSSALNAIDSRVRQSRLAGVSPAKGTGAIGEVGQVVPLARDAIMPGTGLAGRLERAGYTTAAERTAQAGRVVGTVGRLGETVDDLQLAIPVRAAVGLGRRAGAPLASRLGQWATDYSRLNDTRLADTIGRFTPEARAQTRQVRDLEAQLGRILTEQERASLTALSIADAYGISDAHARAATFNVDQRFTSLVDAVRQLDELDPAAAERLIERSYADVPTQLRPTVDDVRAYIDWQAGRLDQTAASAMEQIETAVRDMSQRQTDTYTAAGVVSESQLADEMLPERVAEQRADLEAKRDQAETEWERRYDQAARATRLADVNEAINAELPPPPNPRNYIEQGRAAGEAEQRAVQMRREHQQAVAELRTARDEYLRADAAADPNQGVLARLERDLDAKVDKAESLRADIARLERRRDATVGLSRATGDVVEEAAQQQLRERSMPEIDLSGMDSVAAIRAAVDEIRSDYARQALDEVEAVAGGERLRTPTDAADRAGGNWDWWDSLSPEDRFRYTSNGFMVSKYENTPRGRARIENFGGGDDLVNRRGRRSAADRAADDARRRAGVERGMDPDTFAQHISARLGRTVSVDEAIAIYTRAVDDYLAARSVGSDVAVGRAADELGLSPDTVRLAVEGTAAEFRAAVTADAVDALSELQQAFAEMEPTIADALLGELEQMRAAGVPGDEIADFLVETLDSVGSGSRLLEDIWTKVSWPDVADWLTGKGDVPDRVLKAVVGERSRLAERQIGRLQQAITDTRAQVRSVEADQRSLRTVLDQAQSAADARVDRAGRSLAERAEIADALGEAADDARTIADYVDETTRPDPDAAAWKRTKGRDAAGNVTEPLSPGERTLVRQGVLRERATAAQAVADRVRRRVDRWNSKIADLPNELGRSFQTRLREDINAPAMRGIARVVRKIEQPFGYLTRATKDTPAKVSGVAGRIAAKYDIMDDLATAWDQELQMAGGDFQPLNARRAFETALERTGTVLDDVDRMAMERSWQTDQLLRELRDIEQAGYANGTAANTPFRIIEHVRAARWMADRTMLPDDVLSTIERRWETYLNRRGRFLETSMDRYAAVMPARWRAIGANARRAVRGLLDEAEDFHKAGDPDTAAMLVSMAEDVPTTLQQMIDAGLDPAHLTGGKAPTRAQGTGGGGLPVRSLRASSRLSEGLRPTSLQGVTQLQINQMSNFITNNAAKWVADNMAVPASRVIGDVLDQWAADHPFDRVMPADDLRAALRDAGWEIPTAAEGPIGPATPVIPKSVADQLAREAVPNNLAWRYLNGTNKVFKIAVLPLSPRWLVGNVVGNAFMAMFHAGMSPLRLARTIDEIAELSGGWRNLYRQGGLPDFVPDELASHGLTYNEHQLRWGGDDLRNVDIGDTPTARQRAADRAGRIIAGSYNINEFVDNIGRSAVYLDKLRRLDPDKVSAAGLTQTEAATKAALQAMGDFTRMTPLERRWVRQVYPFYAWMRHQTAAALRLPLESPTRAAFLLHLTNMMTDPELAPDVLEQLGSRIPLGGDRYLNIGGLSPFGDLRNLPLDPTSPSHLSGITPAIDYPFRALTGNNLGTQQHVSRPYDDRPTDLFGREVGLSPLRRALRDPAAGIGELVYTAAGEIPQARGIRDLVVSAVEGEPLGRARYGSGDVVPSHKYDRERSISDVLLQIGNMPRVETVSLTEMMRRARERERSSRG